MDQMATKTMAEIYLRQGHLQEAYEIYKALAERDPFDLDAQRRMEELSEKLNPSCKRTNTNLEVLTPSSPSTKKLNPLQEASIIPVRGSYGVAAATTSDLGPCRRGKAHS